VFDLKLDVEHLLAGQPVYFAVELQRYWITAQMDYRALAWMDRKEWAACMVVNAAAVVVAVVEVVGIAQEEREPLPPMLLSPPAQSHRLFLVHCHH
jgi:anti-sigma-K factor RskA